MISYSVGISQIQKRELTQKCYKEILDKHTLNKAINLKKKLVL